ncbi:hypothetical protein TNCV_5041451 [Trichonephila clavipes]|nr:hypothetical protein TNCV_5041451 [Trichonephila clavipes]
MARGRACVTIFFLARISVSLPPLPLSFRVPCGQTIVTASSLYRLMAHRHLGGRQAHECSEITGEERRNQSFDSKSHPTCYETLELPSGVCSNQSPLDKKENYQLITLTIIE